MNLRGRVGLLAGVAAGVVAALVGVAVFAIYVSGQAGRVDATLARAAAQSAAIAEAIKAKSAETGAAPSLAAPVSVGDVRLQLFPDPITPGSDSAVGPLTDEDASVAKGNADPYFSDITVDGVEFRAYTTHMAGTDQGLVRAVFPKSVTAAERWQLALIIVGVALGIGAATGLVAWALAGRALAPVRRATAAADDVRRTGRLDQRLPTAGTHEVAAMVHAFNDMLDALDESVTAQRQLVADASHELRTPLTSIVTNLDLLDEEPGLTDPAAPDLVHGAREQAHELRHLVDDIIELARQGQVAPVVVPTRLDLLAADVVTRVGVGQDPAPTITLRTDPCPVFADEDAVSRAIANLVTNAVAWTPPDGHITVTTGHDTEGSWVEVADTGPGIPAEDLPLVFQRFYRTPAARSKPGSGLGLAIVAQVAAMHGGRATAESSPEGTRVRLWIPTSSRENSYGTGTPAPATESTAVPPASPAASSESPTNLENTPPQLAIVSSRASKQIESAEETN
jgi:two-component system sensor histidine kinase MprB